MRALITGATGFAGRYLVQHLVQYGELEIHGTCLTDPTGAEAAFFTSLMELDMRDEPALLHCLEAVQPDIVFHLAAQTHVPTSFQAPWETMEINLKSTLNLFESLRALDLLRTRIVLVSSSEVYGAVTPDNLPIKETHPINPTSPYSVSKIAQDMLGLQYFNTYGMPIIRARPFNHIGPQQNPNFAVANFATQIAEIEQGIRPPAIYVGNLSAQRDFSDVRDVVRAYHLLALYGEAGKVYNICSGKARSVQSILEILLRYAEVEVRVEVDSARFRPADIPIIYGDFSALQSVTGWQPSYSVEQTLLDILNNCRAAVASRI